MPLLQRAPARRQFVVNFAEERLIRRVVATQAEDPKRPARECELGPDETMDPVPINRERVAEE